MASTKTTLYLPTELHRRLKATAARTGTTITELVAEGVRIVLDRSQGTADKAELERRAIEAEEALQAGLFDGKGPSMARRADELVYPFAFPEARTKGRRKRRR